jgi:DNA-binding protein YbaB
VAEKTESLEDWAAQAHIVQQRLTAARARLEEAEVTGTAGDGAVSLVLSAACELRAIRIAPDAVDDLNTLERYIKEAHANASADARQLTADVMVPFTEMVSKIGKLSR